MFTGVFPGAHGLTGNSLFFRDRAVARYYTEYHLDAARVQLEEDFAMLTKSILSHGKDIDVLRQRQRFNLGLQHLRAFCLRGDARLPCVCIRFPCCVRSFCMVLLKQETDWQRTECYPKEALAHSATLPKLGYHLASQTLY